MPELTFEVLSIVDFTIDDNLAFFINLLNAYASTFLASNEIHISAQCHHTYPKHPKNI